VVEQGRSRGRTEAWRPRIRPWEDAAPGRPALAWPAGLSEFARRVAQQIQQWAAVETGPGRLVPWLAIAFGCGIAVYFTADREPAPWATLLLLAGAVMAAVLCRRRPVAFPLVLGVAAAAAGLATASLKRAIVAHPVLSAPAWNVDIAGFVERREERERSDRMVVRIDRISGSRLDEKLERVRVSVRKGTAPPVGTFVEFKARLSPPLEPLRPGGYDFARDMYFHGIAASGFVLGHIRTAAAPHSPPLLLRYATIVDAMREAIDIRIRAVLPGDNGAIASALITGKRDAISAPVNEAMYVSGLAHVLSISGYHMAVVTGIVFFAVRALFALMPAFANRHPIKKWAALAALAAAAFYLLLSGAEVATQRSFLMIAIVLVGVMIDRPTLTFRTLTVAALGVLLLAPEAITHPSFQMSFAATLGIVAGYQHGLPWMSRAGKSALATKIALWGGREIVGLLIISLLAGAATIPYIAFHFHRISPYGVIANLVAMPVVSVWVMPAGLLGLASMPLGLDGLCWTLMGYGIDWMVAIALWVNSFPGAVGRVAAFGIGPLLLCSAGLVVLCLLKTPLRLSGCLLIGVAIVLALRTPQPDVLIAGDGSAFAVRGRDGRLSVIRLGSDVFTVREWLAADADARSPKDPALSDGIRCDVVGCIGRLADGSLVAIAKSPEAFEEDCRRAALVLSPGDAPPGCVATLVDRQIWRRSGAIALHRVGDRFATSSTRTAGNERPWAPAARGASSPPDAGRTTAPQMRDATPRSDDLEAGD
jgi:competence protein ComEC